MDNRIRILLTAGAVALASGPAALAGCPGDVDGDGAVATPDLLAILADWGDCPGCASDLTGDGAVDTADLLEVLGHWGPCPGKGDIVPMELAGNLRTQYPGFEFVRAFNEGSSFMVAVDPSRSPDLVGMTVDIYVVESKTAAEWDGDPSLSDETGGSQSETIAAGSITGNRFSISGSNTLSSSVVRGFGHGYDVVIDANQNGVLDGGDYIDGYDDVESGLYVVGDIASNGQHTPVESAPYSVGQVFSIVSTRTFEEVYYPSDIASMGQVPLIVVSHGNGHDYRWYDHIGLHMASYGYIVMSHQNNTGPGVTSALITTLGHTDAFLDQQDTIVGGVLNGHIDSSRIIWIGHSRGAEGVVLAYDRLFDGTYVTTHYDIDDIQIVSSIAPTDFRSTNEANPHDATFSLWTGGSDSDVNGCADCNICQTFHLHDRATEYRHSISLHGCGHGHFHDGGGNPWATGPCLLTADIVHNIMQPYFLSLCERYIYGNIPAKDYLTRQYEVFRAISSPLTACTSVDMMYREGSDAGNYMIDDFQTQSSTGTSSSGGSVTFSVSTLSEGRLDDANSNFTTSGSDPMNGMTVGMATDTTRGVVFEWSASDRFLEFEVVDGDLTGYNRVSFRAAQATRHALTTASLGDLTFTVTLRDGSGTSSSIGIGAYGGGIEEPYQRTRCGTGAGWGNEFENILIRLEDFLTDGSGLDLSDIEAVRFEFGPSHGDSQGRIGLDEIQFTVD